MRKETKKSFQKNKVAINLTIVLLICMVTIIETNIFYRGFNSTPKKADVIIVLGCAVWGHTPSPTLKERIYRAYELYKNGYASMIIATGAKGYGEDVSEAVATKKLLIELGVPETGIIEENNSTNTVENLKFSKELMKKNDFNSAVIVTNYYHIYRGAMIAKDLGIKVSFAKASMPSSKVNLVLSNVREVISVFKYCAFQVIAEIKSIFK